jgi:hypothetical protein
MDSDLDSRRIARPAGRIFTGRVVRLLDGYPREITVGQPVLVAVLAAAGVLRLLLLPLRALLSDAGGGTRRSWKELKKGPEFLVTPLRLRDGGGQLHEVELHGHLPQSALHPADHVQITPARSATRTAAPGGTDRQPTTGQRDPAYRDSLVAPARRCCSRRRWGAASRRSPPGRC